MHKILWPVDAQIYDERDVGHFRVGPVYHSVSLSIKDKFRSACHVKKKVTHFPQVGVRSEPFLLWEIHKLQAQRLLHIMGGDFSRDVPPRR